MVRHRIGLRSWVLGFLLTCSALPALGGWEEGKAALLAGRLEEAAEEFEAVTRAHPEYAPAYYMLGKTRQRQGKSSEALRSLGRAAELDGASAAFSLALAQVQLEVHRPGEALQSLGKHPFDQLPAELRASYLATFATAAVEADPSPETTRALEEAVGQQPGAKSLWLALAKNRERDGTPEAALEAYAAALKIDASDEVLGRKTVQLAWDLAAQAEGEDERQRAYGRAAALARPAAGGEPTASQLLIAGEAALLAGDPAAARSLLAPVAKPGGDASAASQAHYLLARCDLAEGRAEAALAGLEKAQAAGAEGELQRRIYRAQGTAYHLAEKFGLAAAAYRRAGDEEKAAEMVAFGELAEVNDEVDRKRHACREEQARIERLRAEHEGHFGSEDWQRMERLFSAKLAECQPYLES